MSEDLGFLVEDSTKAKEIEEFYTILIVDDEESVHLMTKIALKNKTFDGRKLKILTALSAAEAKKIVTTNDDICLAIVDVVMETPDAGLELVDYIRHELANNRIRLVLRTGQANQAPEEEVIDKYDINDYKEKTELTVQKLYTLVRTSIKQYMQIKELEDSRDEIYRKMTISELTKLPNRMKLNEVLDTSGKKSIILININDFSQVNENFGFESGDKFLIELANFLKNTYSKSMQVFHLHGDVFALLCSSKESDIIEKNINKIKHDIDMQNFMIENQKISFSIRVGVALKEYGNIIQKAELAMKKSITSGDEEIVIYSKS